MIDAKAIPEELRNKPQWVCWRYEQRDGKETKVPINAKTGKLASTTNPKTWTSFDVVMRRYNKANANANANLEPIDADQAKKILDEYVDGIGFVFHDDFIGVDLDHIVRTADGRSKSW